MKNYGQVKGRKYPADQPLVDKNKGVKHGTIRAYMGNCRCKECLKASRRRKFMK